MNPLASALLDEIGQAARELPAMSVERLAVILESAPVLDHNVEAALLAAVVLPASKDRVRRFISCLRDAATSVPPIAVAWALRSANACDGWHRAHERIDLVWTGPTTISQGIYRTHQTLLDIIEHAERSLLIVTFAAYRIEGIRRALWAAADRSIDVALVVETDVGPGGKVEVSPLHELAGNQVGIQLFEWPVEARPREGNYYGALHAKCALADDEVLFVSSANMTGHALELNIELGVLIRGGPVPAQAARHFKELMRKGILRPLV